MRAAFAFAFALALLATPAAADPWAGIEVMDDAALAESRGGLAVAPGIEVNFGAIVTTMVNGTPALQTQLTWSHTGAMISQTVTSAGQQLSALTPTQRDALGIGGMAGANGIVIKDAQGVTALVHNVAEGALQNVILNNASGRDITQNVDITLELPGFEAVQGALTLERFGMRLGSDMGVTF